MDLLTPEQASPIVGVPAVQLRRWAYLRQGPPNRGTKHKPMYDERDLEVWKAGYEKLGRERMQMLIESGNLLDNI